MDETHSNNCKKLPFEVLQKIFQEGDATHSRNYALVCKAWLLPAQTVLYSKVIIKSLQRLKQFYDTTRSSPHLGGMVKNLLLSHFYIDSRKDKAAIIELFDTLKNLLLSALPNIETLKNLNLHSYSPILNALSNSQLKRFRRLAVPNTGTEKNEKATYITCAMLMKDRLENLLILNESDLLAQDVVIKDQIDFQTLYNQLDQFEKLEEVNFEKETEDKIHVLEYVIGACKSLKKLGFNFSQPSNESNSLRTNNNVSIDEISNYTPSINTNSLDGNITTLRDDKILLYIMHKFPQLQHFSLAIKNNSPTLFNQQILTDLLNYISKIDDCSLPDLRVEQETITKSIGCYWDATSGPGGESLEIVFSELQEGTRNLLGLSKQPNRRLLTTLTYPESNLHWRYNEFIERNGKYIGDLQFVFCTADCPDSEDCVLPGNFIPHIFTHCPDLQFLHFEGCMLKPFTYSEADLSKKQSIDVLLYSFAFYTLVCWNGCLCLYLNYDYCVFVIFIIVLMKKKISTLLILSLKSLCPKLKLMSSRLRAYMKRIF